MSKKKVSIAPKPKRTADQWVKAGKKVVKTKEPEPMKRFTIDVPLSLHTRIKIDCAKRGVKMADELRAMLEKKFPG